VKEIVSPAMGAPVSASSSRTLRPTLEETARSVVAVAPSAPQRDHAQPERHRVGTEAGGGDDDVEGSWRRPPIGEEAGGGDAGIVRGHLLGLEAPSSGLALLKTEVHTGICHWSLVFAREHDLEVPALAGVQGQIRVPDQGERIRLFPGTGLTGIAGACDKREGNCCGCAEKHDGTRDAVAWRS
jgi:hypothetical protein